MSNGDGATESVTRSKLEMKRNSKWDSAYMDLDAIVEKILQIPNDYRIATVSPVVLLHASGYFESPEAEWVGFLAEERRL